MLSKNGSSGDERKKKWIRLFSQRNADEKCWSWLMQYHWQDIYKKKTTERITHRFYWPTLHRDIADYCRSCDTCQKFKCQQAPMVPLPIVEEPFARIAMDIVGPLPRSRSGNRYVLVICDYATRYPEAVALKSIDAENMAAELVTSFSRVGILKYLRIKEVILIPSCLQRCTVSSTSRH